MYICSYNRQDDEKSAKSKFANIFIIIMNPYEYVFVDTISLGRFAFISYGDTSDVLSRSSWSCCIIAKSSSIKYTITKGDRPIAAFNKAT